MGTKEVVSILAWVTREMISVTNLGKVYMRREKLYNLSQRDLRGVHGGTHGSAESGKTPLADVELGGL